MASQREDSQRGPPRAELGLPTDPRGVSVIDNHTVLPAELLCRPGSGHCMDEVPL